MLRTPVLSESLSRRWASLGGAVLVCTTLSSFLSRAEAHGISESSSQTMAEGGVLAYVWLGAEHMVTGYDHLLFLFGVLFFLDGFRDVVRFITAFTLGHCITLLGATLAGVTASAYLVDAVIALSVVYKGFENLDGFEKTLGIRPPNLLAMVFVFGLVHGFGLSTRLRELTLADEGLVSRILAFNVGVELGQVVALMVMLLVFKAWRSTKTFERFGRVANGGLVLAGIGLFAFQMNGYVQAGAHHDHHGAEEEAHGEHAAEHGHGHEAPVEPAAGHGHGHETPVEPAAEHGHGHGHGEAVEPAPVDLGRGHGHGHAKDGHGHEEPVEPVEEPAEEEKAQGHGHKHGSGGTHTH